MENLTSLFEGQHNLTWGERVVYVVGGLGLAAAGAQPRPNPLLNVLALAGGAYLAYSGYKGHCPTKPLFCSVHPNLTLTASRTVPQAPGSDCRAKGLRASPTVCGDR